MKLNRLGNNIQVDEKTNSQCSKNKCNCFPSTSRTKYFLYKYVYHRDVSEVSQVIAINN